MTQLLRALEYVYRYPACLAGGGDVHEKSFERVLKQFGVGYRRHPNGRQAFPDFWCASVGVELKSTQGSRIFLNDSFFVDDHLYVISCKKTSVIAFGEDLYTPREKEVYEIYKQQLTELKHRFPTVDRLVLYPRSANQYAISGLRREELWEKVIRKL